MNTRKISVLYIFIACFLLFPICYASDAYYSASNAESAFDDSEQYARRAQNASDADDFNYNIGKAYRAAIEAYDYSMQTSNQANREKKDDASYYARQAASYAKEIVSYIKQIRYASSLEEAQDYARKAKNSAYDGLNYIQQAKSELD